MRSRLLGSAVAVAVLALAAYLLFRALGRYDADAILAAFAGLDAARLAWAGLFALASYVALTGFDMLGLLYAGHRLPYLKVALASFTALSIGHSLGFAALSSGAVRFRFYRLWGLTFREVGLVIAFCGLTVGLGYAVVAGTTLLVRTGGIAELTGVGAGLLTAWGVFALLLPVAYLGAVLWRRPLRLGRLVLAPPTPTLAIGQIVLGCLDLMLVAAVLHQLVGVPAGLGYPAVLTVYVAAALAGLLSHAPGGIGVVEAVTLALVPGPATIAGLVAFRAIYFFVPLLLGGAALALFELMMRRPRD